jgi:hypothetical protein
MSNNKQQTAVDSIIELCQELLANHYSISHDAVCSEVIKFCQEQAKEMEKERMIDFANNCIKQIEVSDTCELLMVESPKDLYQQTYGGDNQ